MKKLLKLKVLLIATTNDQVDQGNNNGHTAIAPIQPETIKNQKLNKQ